MQAKFLTGAWRYLAMMNWTVDPAILAPLVPAGTTLDSFDGQTFISLVGFMFEDTRILGVPVPGHREFEEVNLRFYVRRDDPESGEVKRAVVFVREIVPKAAIAVTARLVYNERYVAHPMDHALTLPGPVQPAGRVEYGWTERGERLAMVVDFVGDPEPIPTGGDVEFITEHFWGYVTQRDGGTVEYQVEHPRWLAWRATGARLVGAVPEYYGAPFAEAMAEPSHSAFVATGSDIVVRKPRRVA